MLAIEGGNVNKKQTYEEFIRIIEERNEKSEKIIKKAKQDGIWNEGLDSNRPLFEKLDKETNKKIEELKKMIDE